MPEKYQVIGAQLSPFSIKVRSYFRYKDLPHDWIEGSPASVPQYKHLAKLPLVPLVITPDEKGMQDSTPIIEKLEAKFPEPSIHPSDEVSAFISALLEEYGDEWGNKWMFGLRWNLEVDQRSAAERIGPSMDAEMFKKNPDAVVAAVLKRMPGRIGCVGANEVTLPQIERTLHEAARCIETHLQSRPYLFGARPSFADFGMFAQLHQCWTDPTPGGFLKANTPNLCAWLERMLDPKAEGEFESWAALEPTLMPLLTEQVGANFLPWSEANRAALESGQEEFTVEIGSGTWTQNPQKYHARSLAAIRQKYAEVKDKAALDPILEKSGCLRWLKG
jgi:glutathione S-transferase